MNSERIYYNIWFLGFRIDDVEYATREEAQAKCDTLEMPSNIALVGEDFVVEEWTPQNTWEENRAGWLKVNNLEQFEKWTRLAAYENPARFAEVTGMTFDELKGKWFTISDDRVFFEEDGIEVE